MNTEGKDLFRFTMLFSGIIGGVIWLLAMADHFINGNSWANTHGPIIGIPLGLGLWGTALWFYCRTY